MAFNLVRSLGLESYYQRRCIDPAQRPTRPDASAQPRDLSAWIRAAGNDRSSLVMLVDGLHCGACMWLIEQSLARQPGVLSARVSLTTRRLSVSWNPQATRAEALVAVVEALGYRLTPLPEGIDPAAKDTEGAKLLRCMAVAGFAAGNIMLFSVSVWSGNSSMIDAGTRDLFHWISAMIALPAIAYAGRPFFASALGVLKRGRTNMDVPISIAVILAPSVSLYETFTAGQHAYFDAAVTLLFFLLVGRYLDHRVRHMARRDAAHLLAISETVATIIEQDGTTRECLPRELKSGVLVLVSPGGRVPADGTVEAGRSDLDWSLINGESLPRGVSPGEAIFAGTLNLTGVLRVRVENVGDDTLLAGIIRLIEAAETRRGLYVRIADKVARYYAPVVHVAAISTFLGWVFAGGMAWQDALMIAVSVLIITCPCALALAVPVVQVVASQRLMKSGILLKNGDALERLAQIDHVVLDKTGTLTLGRIAPIEQRQTEHFKIAAAIAANSRHPLARALAAACPASSALENVEEIPGRGLIWHGPDGDWRLGSAAFAGAMAGDGETGPDRPAIFLRDPGGATEQFAFADRLRSDAKAACASLETRFTVEILSGDATQVVQRIAREVDIVNWRAEALPSEKAARLGQLADHGRRVLMVGDGLNDAPSLATAHVSMAPSTWADLAQVKADIVFQGDRLGAVPLAIAIARHAGQLMRQNLALALFYNLAAVPLAVLGFVTPLIAALAMSSSSILVVANSMRLGRSSPSGGALP